MNSQLARPRYAPSGRWDLRRLPFALGLWCLASLAVSLSFLGMITSGIYPALASISMPCLALAGITGWTVRWTKIRSPRLAIALASLAAVGGYVGYWHLDQCVRWGAPWGAVDRLPGYIAFRLTTDQWVARHGHRVLAAQQPAAGGLPGAPIQADALLSTHTLNFFYELVAVVICGRATGWIYASLPFSERRGVWMRSERRTIGLSDFRSLYAAVTGDSTMPWENQPSGEPDGRDNPTQLVVWFAPSTGDDEMDSDVLVQFGGRGHCSHLPLAEAAELVRWFPGLQEMTGPAKDRLSREADHTDDPASARIERLPPQFAGKALTAANRFWAGLIAEGLPFGVLAAGMVLMFGGVLAVGGLQMIGVIRTIDWVLVPILGGPLLIVIGLQYCGPKHGLAIRARTRFERAKLLAALAARPDRLVSPGDPRAVLVTVLPRQHWESPGDARPGEFDQGWMRVDNERQQILFEVDYERYIIPAAAVLDFQIEPLPHQLVDPGPRAALVVQTRLGTGLWEFPFSPLGHASKSWELALGLLGDVDRLTIDRENEEPAPADRDASSTIA